MAAPKSARLSPSPRFAATSPGASRRAPVRGRRECSYNFPTARSTVGGGCGVGAHRKRRAPADRRSPAPCPPTAPRPSPPRPPTPARPREHSLRSSGQRNQELGNIRAGYSCGDLLLPVLVLVGALVAGGHPIVLALPAASDAGLNPSTAASQKECREGGDGGGGGWRRWWRGGAGVRVVGLLRRQAHAVLVQVHHQPRLDPRHELPAAPHLDRRPRSVMEAIEVKDFVVVVRAAELGVGALEG